jgi:hypothetical protein
MRPDRPGGPASGEGRRGHDSDSPRTTEPADPAEARRVRLAGFWAIVLRRFRDQVQGPGDRGLPQARPTEEDT